MDRLPDLCLRTIFTHLPLSDFLVLNLVCRRWYRLHSQLASARHSLTLLIGLKASEYLRINSEFFGLNSPGNSDHDRLEFDHPHMSKRLDEAALTRIMQLLPTVSDAEIACVFIPGSEIPKITRLIQKWSDKLESLKLYCWFQDPNQAEVVRLFQAITDCSRLRRLTLEIRDLVDITESRKIFPDLLNPVLDQLEQFRFVGDAEFGFTIEQLQKSDNLKQISLGKCAETDEKSLDELLSLDRKLTSKFQHLNLHFGYSIINQTQLNHLVNQFQSLKSLVIHEKFIQGPLPLSQLARSLSKLSQLEHLTLWMDFTYRQPLSVDDKLPQERISQLATVKYLTIHLRMSSHTDLQCRHLGWIFPSVSEVRIYIDTLTCKLCGNGQSTRSAKCIGALMQPLKLMKSLDKIVTNQPRGSLHEWTIDQL